MRIEGEVKIKTLVQACSIFIFLLFLPYGNPFVYLATTAPDWYGEFGLEVDGVYVGVMKNASPASIQPTLITPKHVAIRGFDRELDVTFSPSAEGEFLLPPRSYGMSLGEANGELARYAQIADGRRFEVKELLLVTPAERSLWALGYVAVLLGFGYLSYRGTAYLMRPGRRPTEDGPRDTGSALGSADCYDVRWR